MDELVINQSMTIAILTHSSTGWENASAGKEIDELRYGVKRSGEIDRDWKVEQEKRDFLISRLTHKLIEKGCVIEPNPISLIHLSALAVNLILLVALGMHVYRWAIEGLCSSIFLLLVINVSS